jgi:2,3-bisphosphoglycerate-dependent phosphoglycerate mutase
VKTKTLVIFLLAIWTTTAGNWALPAEREGETTLIFVRHAEKAMDGTADPPLTAEGEKRAEDLARALGLLDIQAVYVTPYRRTRKTAAPLAELKGLSVREYRPGREKEFVQRILAGHRGETVLIVGHSNTVARLANASAGRDQYADLEDFEYDSLFLAVFPGGGGPAAVYRFRFGSPSAAKSPGGVRSQH